MAKSNQLEKLRRFLEEHPREATIEWLLGAAKDLPEFRQRLALYAATHEQTEDLVETARAAVLRLTELYRQSRNLKASDITPTLQFLVQVFAACLDRGKSPEALPLLEEAILTLDRLCYSLQKTQLKWTTIQRELETLHLRSVVACGLGGAELARRIFTLQSSAHGDLFPEAPAVYSQALGERGVAHYRELLEPAYQALVHGQPQKDRTISALRTFLRQRPMLGAWANHAGTMEERLEILIALSMSPQEVLTAAKQLEAKGYLLEALQTVKKGYERFEAKNPYPLALFLAERHESMGQFEAALEYRWRIYTHNPTLESYRKLMATAAPARQAQRYVEPALDVAAEKSNSLYAQLLLELGRLEEALEAAREGGAATSTWASLAAGHAEKDPAKAIELYFHCLATSLVTAPGQAPNYLNEAWKLALDPQTFQVFRNCLQTLAANQYVMPSVWSSAEAAGVPVSRLLS